MMRVRLRKVERVVVGAIVVCGGNHRAMAQDVVAGQGSVSKENNALRGRHVTMHIKRMSRMEAIDSLSQLARVPVQYRAPLLDAYPERISLDVLDLPLGVALERVLEGTPLRVLADGVGHLTIASAAVAARADSTPVRGVVSGEVVDSATGKRLRGVVVQVDGTKIRVTTGEDGRFTFENVSAGDQAVTARLFGYRPMTILVSVTTGTAVHVRLPMVAAPNVLTQVVTTATGMQRKLEVGNDVATINVDSVMRTAPVATIADLLESRVPGLFVQRSSGIPGASSRIRIRGVSSITRSNDPIVIVDGLRVYAAQSDGRLDDNVAGQSQSPFDQIDPNSIATLEVFKGPSASALYGSDAANGVIVITTKRGQAGATRWSAVAGGGWSSLPDLYPDVYFQWGGPFNGDSQICRPEIIAYGDLGCDVDSVTHFQALNDRRFRPFTTGTNGNGSVSLSGGSSSLTYSLTASAARTIGVERLPDIEVERFTQVHGFAPPAWVRRPDRYTTWGGAAQITAQVNPTLNVAFQSTLFQSAQQKSSLDATAIGALLTAYIDTLGSTPIIPHYVDRQNAELRTIRYGGSVNWSARSWLPILITAGIDTKDNTDHDLVPRNYDYAPSDTIGQYGVSNGTAEEQTLGVGTRLPLFRSKLVTALGFNLNRHSTTDVDVRTKGLAPGVETPNSFIPESTTVSSDGEASSTYGWYMEPRLQLSSRLFVSPGFRLDGGSASGSHAGVSAFPKIDISWIALDRQDMAPLAGVFSLIRPRVAIGMAGVQPKPGDKLRLFQTVVGTLDGGVTQTDLTKFTLGNTLLRPERSRELEGGGEIYLWGDRVQLDLTAYRKTKLDAIVAVPVGPSVGSTLDRPMNIGVVRNAGAEATFTLRPVTTPVLSWQMQVNGSRNKNRLVRLNREFTSNYSLGLVPGYPIFSLFSASIAGFADFDGNGRLTLDEIVFNDQPVYRGTPLPRYDMATTNDVTLFGGTLGLHWTLNYQNGITQNNPRAAAFQSAFAKPGASLADQAAYIGNVVPNPGFSGFQYGLQTVNILRFTTLSVNYTFPRRVANLLRGRDLGVAVQGSNLGLWTSYQGADPGVNSDVTGNLLTDSGSLPLLRSWSLRFTLGN